MQWCHGINNCCSIVFFPPSQLISVTEVANTSQLVLFTKNDSRMKSNEEKTALKATENRKLFVLRLLSWYIGRYTGQLPCYTQGMSSVYKDCVCVPDFYRSAGRTRGNVIVLKKLT